MKYSMVGVVCLFVGFLVGMFSDIWTSSKRWEKSVVFSKDSEGYTIDLMGLTPKLAFSGESSPMVAATMTTDGKIEASVFLTQNTQLERVKIVPQEDGFSSRLFKDGHGQTWTIVDGEDAKLHCDYWGRIAMDGGDICFYEGLLKEKVKATWKLGRHQD